MTLAALAPLLRCPNCGAPLAAADAALACARGHSFDVARQGYVALPSPRGKRAPGDTQEMVAARDAFLGAGHYTPLAKAVTAAARQALHPPGGEPSTIIDLGAGTGHYLGALLGELHDARGIALDASPFALRRAVRAHPGIAAVACDTWRELPLQDASAHLVLNVFAPRNGREIARVLSPGGALIVVTPTPEHLREIVSELGMLQVDADKGARLHAGITPHLSAVNRREVEFKMTLRKADIHALVAMGPSAAHVSDGDVRLGLARLPERPEVTASVLVETFAR